MASTLLTTIVVFWLLSCAVIAIFNKNINHTYPSIALFVGGVVMIAAAVLGWNRSLSGMFQRLFIWQLCLSGIIWIHSPLFLSVC